MALLTERTATFDRGAGVLRVTGADRLRYLNSLFSQQLESARAGTAADFLYLDAKGNPLAEGRAVVVADAVLLIIPRAVSGSLAEALGRFTFLLEASTEDLSEQWAVVSVRGRGQTDVAGARSEPMTVAPRDDGWLVRDRSGGVDVVGPRTWTERFVSQLALPSADAEDWEAWRIAAGQPAWDSEIVPGRRAHELGLLPTHVHLRKGCYPGQESIAKIHNLGRPRRALAVLDVAGAVAAGDVVTVDGRKGEVTSAAQADGAWIALALLPVGADGEVPGDGEVTVGEVPARVRARVGASLPIPGAEGSPV